MSADNTTSKSEGLQFDRAVSSAPGTGSQDAGVVCANCRSPIATEYFHVGSHSVCAQCRDVIVANAATPRGWRPFLKASVFGIGAAIAGAIIYYAVIALMNLEIGIVAILIGYMVGKMVRQGAGQRGGKRFQILALALTYWSVGLAYTPLAFKGLADKDAKKSTVAAADSSRAARPDSAGASAKGDSGLTRQSGSAGGKEAAKPMTGGQFLLGIGAILFLTVSLPVFVVVGSMPSGILSAIIIAIGLMQAWRMTGAANLNVSGPYKVAANPPPNPA